MIVVWMILIAQETVPATDQWPTGAARTPRAFVEGTESVDPAALWVRADHRMGVVGCSECAVLIAPVVLILARLFAVYCRPVGTRSDLQFLRAAGRNRSLTVGAAFLLLAKLERGIPHVGFGLWSRRSASHVLRPADSGHGELTGPLL